jgi:hypothetical protein
MPHTVLTGLATLVLLLAHPAWALETKTEQVGRLNVVTETEGPYVESGDKAFALPSIETAVAVKDRDFEGLRRFLLHHCAKKPGCRLTYETETKAVVAATAPSGQTFLVPYTERTKRTAPGTPKTVRTVLRGWSHDTYMLVIRTEAGNYCIPNDYAWKDYADAATKVLTGLGEQETPLRSLVEVTVFPMNNDASEDCAGFLGNVTLAR